MKEKLILLAKRNEAVSNPVKERNFIEFVMQNNIKGIKGLINKCDQLSPKCPEIKGLAGDVSSIFGY